MVATTAIAALVIGCDAREPATASTAPPAVEVTEVDATALFEQFQCARCHDVPGVAAMPRDKHCVACHRDILDGTFEADAAVLAKWQRRITSLPYAPSLANADRLRRDWVRAFLREPHDVRPGLVAEMPRLALGDRDAEQLAIALVPSEPATAVIVTPARIAHGEALYRALACGRCHRFTGASVDDPALHAAGRDQPQAKPGAWALAPDLRYARDRVQPSRLAEWISSPRGAMPELGVAAADARDLAAFVAATPLSPVPARTVPARLPVLARAVTWDEVSERVFRDTCWHCHAVPDFARGDGGPGNSGGFGFRARGLDVSSYAGISVGSIDHATGERRSIFAALPDGTPRVVAHLMARHAEAAGRPIEGVRGMPLGLPPLPLEEIQLVETWIAQGRRR